MKNGETPIDLILFLEGIYHARKYLRIMSDNLDDYIKEWNIEESVKETEDNNCF